MRASSLVLGSSAAFDGALLCTVRDVSRFFRVVTMISFGWRRVGRR
jgi:hypothetical protein